jgi:hypothetical protein
MTMFSVPARADSPPAVEAVAIAPGRVNVYWNPAANAAGYAILRDGREIGRMPADAKSFTDTGVEPGRTYRYDVAVAGTQPAGRGYVERTFATLPDRTECDVLVVGATTAGVSAAVTAARYGLNVVLIEETRRLGGMPVNGLGATDLRRLQHSSGFFEEFRRKVQSLYGTGDGLKYEPRVAHQAIKEIVWAEPGLTVHRKVRPVRVEKRGASIAAVIAEEVGTGRRVTFRPKLIVDATETGDVAAWAGAPFRVGREPRSEREPHAGHLYYDRKNDKALPGSTGRGDKRVQAYAYLMTVKDYGPGADRTIPMPEGYDPKKYEHAVPWDKSWAVSSGKLPNNKFEVNAHPHGSDLAGVNYHYPTTSYAERRRVEKLYRDHALGYLYYIQTVEGKKHIGLSEDDYRDSGGWPQLLYIREARRFEADQMLDEWDIDRARDVHRANVIGIGDYPMDSHAVQPKTDWTQDDMGEGEFYLPQYTPWHQVPYHIMIPRRVDNVFTPTAVSATHVAYGTVRLEPVRMHFGEAAGVAAYLCLRHGVTPRTVPVRQVQNELLKHRAPAPGHRAMDGIGAPGPNPHPTRLYMFADITPEHRRFRAIQWLGARGFYPASRPIDRGPVSGLRADPFGPEEAVDRAAAAELLRKVTARATGVEGFRPAPVPADLVGVTGPLTRAAGARILAAAMQWQPRSAEFRYADVPAGTPEGRAAEALFDHWIDSRMWDGAAALAPGGRYLFQPEKPLTRAEWAELLYLVAQQMGPLWLDHPADRLPGADPSGPALGSPPDQRGPTPFRSISGAGGHRSRALSTYD